MNRRVLLAFGALVAAAALILYLAINAEDSSARSTTQEAVATKQASSTTSSQQTSSPATQTTTTATTQTGDRPPPKEYVVDGVKIRDHRRGDRPPITEAPPREQVRKLPTPITQEIGGKFQTVFRDCMKAIPKEAKGEKPRATGSMIVAIKDQKLTVVETNLDFNNVAPDAAAAAKQCVSQHAVGLSAAAANETDVDRHAISVSLVIR
jgi:hypothetical protein